MNTSKGDLKKMGEKIAQKKATPEEKLAFLKEMNQLVSGMRDDISALKISQKKKEIMRTFNTKHK